MKFLQLRETLVTGVFGCAFLISALVRRPLIYELARATESRKSAASARGFEQLNAQNPHVRRSMLVMTVVWGCGLIVQTAVACALVFAVPIKTFLVISPILGYGTMGALAAWTVWYVRGRRRMRAAVSP
jgi:FtsH-binding integral membrane protein